MKDYNDQVRMFENRNRMKEKITFFPFVAGEMLEEARKTVADQMRGEMTRTMRSRTSKYNESKISHTIGDIRSGSMTPKQNAWLKEDLN